MFRNTYVQIFPRLHFLSLESDSIFEEISLTNLLYLKVEYCPIEKLSTITDLAPELRSLDVCVDFNCSNLEVFSLPSRLIRLKLNMKCK
jgi:hypothetical protein